MGRTILADEHIQTYVENLQKGGTWHLGLIIGKLTNQKDYVVHMVRTPEPMEDQASDEEASELSESTTRKRRKSQTKPPSLEDMNEQWASTHAKQVTMMLPGGLSVIGIFAIAPEMMLTKSQAKLRQILFAIQKQDKKSMVPEVSNTSSDRILLQICSTTKKYTCRTIDVQDQKSTFRPGEWKFQSSSEKWNCLRTNLAITVPVHVPEKSQTASLAKQIQTGLQPFCNSVWTSLVQIDGDLRDGSELLDQSVDKKSRGKEKGQKNLHTQQTFHCSVLVQPSKPCPSAAPIVETCSTSLNMRGTIHGRAYVTSKSTVEDAQQALQVDIIRSVLSRSELLCDDLQMVEEDAEKLEVYTTPRRVFFKLPGTNIELSDYMFTDEKPVEVKGRVRELLDISLEEVDLDLSTERAATEEDCEQLRDGDLSDNGVPEMSTESSKGLKYYIVAGVGGVLAITMAAMSYLLSEQS